MNEGFVDIQVNGYGGADYNSDGLTADQLHQSCVRQEADGVAGLLATIISAPAEDMLNRVRRVVKYRAQDPLLQKMIWGMHIEGPFISPEDGYRGAHPLKAMTPVNLDIVAKFFDACEGLLRIFTLAPEVDPGLKGTRWLAQRKVCVAGGHSNASLDQIKGAIDAGMAMWTHIGNGCPAQMQRHDNVIQRVLSMSDKIWCCFIGDGVHVPLFALKNYLKAADPKRTIVTTDAVFPAGLGPGKFNMGPAWGDVVIGEDMAIWAPDHSHFLGSASTMRHCYKNLSRGLGLAESQIADLLIHWPAEVAKGALKKT